MTRLSPWLSWSVKPYQLKQLNKQPSCWQSPLLKNRSLTLHLCSQIKASQNLAKPLDLETDPVFVAANNILVTSAQHLEKYAVTATKLAILQTFVNRLPKTSNPPELPLRTLLHRDPGGKISGYFSRTTSPMPLPRMAFSTRTALPSPTNNLLPYASPPIKPIGQVTLTASKGSSTCDLTFQIINTAQPALLSIEASQQNTWPANSERLFHKEMFHKRHPTVTNVWPEHSSRFSP